MVLPSFPWRASSSVHDGRRPVFHVYPFTGPCKGPCTSTGLVRGFAQFSMARVQFRPRRASASFSRVPVHGSVYAYVPSTWFCPVFHGARPVPSTTAVGHFFTCTRSRVRVRVRASSVLLPSFPWRASSSVHDGRRPVFHVYPFTGPCKGPCTSTYLVRGFAQFSMARVQFRPRRASASFSRVPVHGSV